MACFCGGDKSAVEVTMEPPRFPGKNIIAPNVVRNNGLFEKIHKERTMYILFFLDPLSVCRFSRCSKSLKEIVDDNHVWQWRLKPPERHEQNGSKENVDVPAKIQFLRTMAPTSLWFYVSAASKFMRNFSSQSSITALTQVIDRPNQEDSPYRKYLAERYLENEIVTMLLEDDEWKPPVIGCVATIMLGLKGRGSRYPALIQQLWQLVLDTEVADKIVPKLVVAAYFADPNFEKNAVEFVKNAVKFIQESGGGTTDEEEEKHASIASTMSYKSEDEKLGSRRTASVSSMSHDGADSHSSPDLPANPSPPKKKGPPKHLRRPSVKYVDVFCLTCALLTVVEMTKEFRKARAQVAALLPPEIVRLNDHHAYNRTAKSAKEWCQVIKDNTAALNLKKGKCVIM